MSLDGEGNMATITTAVGWRDESGFVACDYGSVSPESYTGESTQTFAATPRQGFEFVQWTVDGVQVSTNATYEIPEPSADYTLVAEFAFTAAASTITVEVFPAGAGTVSSPSLTFTDGDVVPLSLPTPTPSAGYEFGHWALDGTTITSLYPSAATHTLTAVFVAAVEELDGEDTQEAQYPDFILQSKLAGKMGQYRERLMRMAQSCGAVVNEAFAPGYIEGIQNTLYAHVDLLQEYMRKMQIWALGGVAGDPPDFTPPYDTDPNNEDDDEDGPDDINLTTLPSWANGSYWTGPAYPSDANHYPDGNGPIKVIYWGYGTLTSSLKASDLTFDGAHEGWLDGVDEKLTGRVFVLIRRMSSWPWNESADEYAVRVKRFKQAFQLGKTYQFKIKQTSSFPKPSIDVSRQILGTFTVGNTHDFFAGCPGFCFQAPYIALGYAVAEDYWKFTYGY